MQVPIRIYNIISGKLKAKFDDPRGSLVDMSLIRDKKYLIAMIEGSDENIKKTVIYV